MSDASNSNRPEEEDRQPWSALVQSLLPQKLPAKVDACSELLATRFRGCLPQGVTQAAASLSALLLEQHARALLVDFLKEHRDAPRLHKLLRMHLLFWERAEKANETVVASEPVTGHQEETPLGTDSDWEWTPLEEELRTPDVDDSNIRAYATTVQENIGAYRPKESGSKVSEFDDLANGKAWLEVTPIPPSDQGGNESVLLKRIAKLGKTALDLLSYFADNPGDRAVHAEGVLGYPTSDINRLLLGSLSHYVKRSDSGGWECHQWVFELLSALDEIRKEG